MLMNEKVFSSRDHGKGYGSGTSSPELISDSHFLGQQVNDTFELEISLALLNEDVAQNKEFSKEKLVEYVTDDFPGACGLMHECMISYSLTDIGLFSLPSLSEMTKRLRPKMVQDPLLDQGGKPYHYKGVLSKDILPSNYASDVRRIQETEPFLMEPLYCDLSDLSDEDDMRDHQMAKDPSIKIAPFMVPLTEDNHLPVLFPSPQLPYSMVADDMEGILTSAGIYIYMNNHC